jgi:hypothetical protein
MSSVKRELFTRAPDTRKPSSNYLDRLMAIPRSPLLDRSAASPSQALRDLEDPEGSDAPEFPATPDPHFGNGGRQGTPPPPEDPQIELARLRLELQQANQRIAVLRRATTVTPSP